MPVSSQGTDGQVAAEEAKANGSSVILYLSHVAGIMGASGHGVSGMRLGLE